MQTFCPCLFEQIHVTIITQTQVAIIGGGLAGLHAAHLLHRAGISFQLFEARDRLGGRILTVDEAGRADEDGFDLGPSWFWPDMQPGLGDLVDELSLGTFAQHTWGDRFWGECPLGNGRNELGKILMQVRAELRAKAVESAVAQT